MKFLGFEISKKLFIGIIASIVIVGGGVTTGVIRSEEHTSELQSQR